MDFIARAAFPVSASFFVALLWMRIQLYSQADGIAYGDSSVIGSDFLAFWTSASAFVEGRALEMYDAAAFEAALSKTSGMARHFMFWQYPPTAFFLFAPLALFSYVWSYSVWMTTTITALFLSLRSIGLNWSNAAIILCAPVTILAMNVGQISFLTAALLIFASFFARERPIIAGVAAGLLTIKPQLGVLIPIAYAVAGCWRAFFVAALTALLLAAASLMVFGAEGWVLFVNSIFRIYTDYLYDGGSTPPDNMTTLMSQLRLLSVDQSIASVAQYGFALFVAAIVAVVWRFVNDSAIRGGVLCAATILVTPYAYNYEMTVLAATVAAIALKARETGWLPLERPAFLLAWVCMGAYEGWGLSAHVQVPFLVTLSFFALILRRALISAGGFQRIRGFLPAMG